MHVTCPAHLNLLDSVTNNVWWSIKVTKLLTMQSSPSSRHFLPLRSKYSPQNPVLKHPESVCFSVYERPIFTPICSGISGHATFIRVQTKVVHHNELITAKLQTVIYMTSHLYTESNLRLRLIFCVTCTVRGWKTLAQSPSWTTPCRLSATAYSIH